MEEEDSTPKTRTWWKPLTIAFLIVALGIAAGYNVIQGQIHKLNSTVAKQNVDEATLVEQQAQLQDLLRRIDSSSLKVEHSDCEQRNRIVSGLLLFVEDTATRSKRQAEATLNSPTASESLKAAAVANLAEIHTVEQNLTRRVPAEKCK